MYDEQLRHLVCKIVFVLRQLVYHADSKKSVSRFCRCINHLYYRLSLFVLASRIKLRLEDRFHAGSNARPSVTVPGLSIILSVK